MTSPVGLAPVPFGLSVKFKDADRFTTINQKAKDTAALGACVVSIPHQTGASQGASVCFQLGAGSGMLAICPQPLHFGTERCRNLNHGSLGTYGTARKKHTFSMTGFPTPVTRAWK